MTEEETEALFKRYPILKFFEYAHLPEGLQNFSRPFCEMAFMMATRLPQNAETSAGLRKLLEAKDCFVRARLP